MPMDSALPVLIIALGVPGVLVVVALWLARHRHGPVATWLQRHTRGLMLASGAMYLVLAIRRFVDPAAPSSFEALFFLCAGIAFLGAVVLGYPAREETSG